MEKYYGCVCPLCKKLNNNFLLKYPGIFFGITELRKCNICDLVFGHEFPNKDELDEYYKLGFFYDGIPNAFDPKILNWHFKVCEYRLNDILSNVNYDFQNVIDIGGGFAKFGHVLKEKCLNTVYDIIEPDPNVNIIWGDWVNNHYNYINEVRDNYYDLAILSHVLEHQPDPIEFITSIKSKMKPKSYIFVEVPYKDYLFKKNVAPHVTFWNERSVKYLAKKNNSDLIFMNTVGLPHKLSRILYRNKTLLQKFFNPWTYIDKIKDVTKRNELPFFTTERMFGLNKYGGNRMWLRFILRFN